MQRMLERDLLEWKNNPLRMPLLVRGARQVGKSYLIEQFGKTYFSDLALINFEKTPLLKEAFTTFNPKEICNRLAILTGKTITPGETLLFLDEIQECPAAIQALRYFKEELPQLHVIGAGSLLDFVLNDEAFKMPVGRVQFYFLKPLSFKEFLLATRNQALLDALARASTSLEKGIDSYLHTHALNWLRKYLVLGGMPGIIYEYLATENFSACQERQANLLMTYRNDFGKYAKMGQHKYLQAFFEKAPFLVGQHFRYKDIDAHMQSRDLKTALTALKQAGLLYSIGMTRANGLPLNASVDEKRFKLLFLDTGLIQYKTHLSSQLLLAEDFLAINRGQLIEQFVGQELLTLGPVYEPGELYYWERTKPGSTAEVDYVIQVDADPYLIPIEVKAGKTGRLKSLHIFIQEKQSRFGVRISQQPLSFENNILSVPLYMIHELPRLISWVYISKLR